MSIFTEFQLLENQCFHKFFSVDVIYVKYQQIREKYIFPKFAIQLPHSYVVLGICRYLKNVFLLLLPSFLLVSFCSVVNMLQYIRLAAETDIEKVTELLRYHWNLRPNAVISIYGDDQISRSNPKLAAAVSEGLTLVRIIPII